MPPLQCDGTAGRRLAIDRDPILLARRRQERHPALSAGSGVIVACHRGQPTHAVAGVHREHGVERRTQRIDRDLPVGRGRVGPPHRPGSVPGMAGLSGLDGAVDVRALDGATGAADRIALGKSVLGRAAAGHFEVGTLGRVPVGGQVGARHRADVEVVVPGTIHDARSGRIACVEGGFAVAHDVRAAQGAVVAVGTVAVGRPGLHGAEVVEQLVQCGVGGAPIPTREVGEGVAHLGVVQVGRGGILVIEEGPLTTQVGEVPVGVHQVLTVAAGQPGRLDRFDRLVVVGGVRRNSHRRDRGLAGAVVHEADASVAAGCGGLPGEELVELSRPGAHRRCEGGRAVGGSGPVGVHQLHPLAGRAVADAGDAVQRPARLGGRHRRRFGTDEFGRDGDASAPGLRFSR